MKELNFMHNNGLDSTIKVEDMGIIIRINQDALHHMTSDNDDNVIVSHFGQDTVYRIKIIISLSQITHLKRDYLFLTSTVMTLNDIT